MTSPILEVLNLSKTFSLNNSWLSAKQEKVAVDDVTLQLFESQTLAIVGESGSGKSTLARTITGIEKQCNGEIYYRGHKLKWGNKKDNQIRYKKIRMVFQDPYSSLNPTSRVGAILDKVLLLNTALTPKQRRKKIDQTLQRVGLLSEHKHQYPHMFSGGQRQRLAIARAIISEPDIIVADEPLSALDVSIQAQILNLLQELQEQTGVSYIFISHDLSVVEHIADRIAVMYGGQIVEHGEVAQIFDRPRHPYTQALFASTPIYSGRFPHFEEAEFRSETELDSQNACCFADRCPYAQDICRQKKPESTATEPNHWLRCFRPE